MDDLTHLICFRLDDQRFALRLDCVQRVVRAVEITPLPHAPDVVLGIINMQGQVIPVINLRQRFALPNREIELNDQFIVAHAASRTLALWVDDVIGVIPQRAANTTLAATMVSRPYVEGVMKFDDGLVLIHNLDAFLQGNEGDLIDTAMKST